MAIYLGNTKVSGAGVQVDSSLSTTSTRPVQNKTVTDALENVGYSTWQKPAGWIDIRSGALANSIYFLVGHSADYTTYPDFNFTATISNSGTYDVFVDGIKKATTASAAETALNWQTLALTSGWDVTHPSSLRTHVIRITPSVSTNTITDIKTTLDKNKGIMWMHFNIDNPINITNLFNIATNNDATKNTEILEAVTTQNGELKVSGALRAAFHYAHSLVELPTLISTSNDGIDAYRAFRQCYALRRVKFKDFRFSNTNSTFYQANAIEEVITENTILTVTDYTFSGAEALKRLPSIEFANNANIGITTTMVLEDTLIDASQTTGMTKLGIFGSSAKPSYGIKGVIVSNAAPFTGTIPQISVNYTGLDRAALVNLFNSLPYNVGYNVTGAPTITDGVASGFSTSDYASLSMPFVDDGNDFEYAIAFNSNTTNNGPIAGVTNGYNAQRPNWSLHNSGCVRFKIASGVTISTTNAISAGVDYQAILSRTGTTYTLKLYSGTTLLETQTLTSETLVGAGGSNTFAFGYDHSTYNSAFNGSIDFNNTYIKRKGVVWFSGAATMTKTCSVVGCTGTADLTTEDKAIATGKGWELTVE